MCCAAPSTVARDSILRPVVQRPTTMKMIRSTQAGRCNAEESFVPQGIVLDSVKVWSGGCRASRRCMSTPRGNSSSWLGGSWSVPARFSSPSKTQRQGRQLPWKLCPAPRPWPMAILIMMVTTPCCLMDPFQMASSKPQGLMYGMQVKAFKGL